MDNVEILKIRDEIKIMEGQCHYLVKQLDKILEQG